jgi:hypothetical protein
MLVPNHPIFRQNAVKHYMQSREKDTLPRFISLPIALFLWALLGLLLVVGLLAWYEQIPTYATGRSGTQPQVYVALFSARSSGRCFFHSRSDKASPCWAERCCELYVVFRQHVERNRSCH